MRIEHPDALSSYTLIRLYSSTLYSRRESSTNPPFSCKTNPISKNTQMNVSPVRTINYEQIAMNHALKANPKRTQTNPNKANPTPILRPSGPPKAKANPNKPNQSQFPKNPKKSTQLLSWKRVTTMEPPSALKERTQTKPNKSACGGQLPGLSGSCHRL